MLEHVDTVLSFAVVMLLLSLLITGLVQIVVAMFAQRRAVLRLGIERLVKQIVPGLGDKDAAALADAVLTHPALSLGKSSRTAGSANSPAVLKNRAAASTDPPTAPADPPAADKRSPTAILKSLIAILNGPTAIKKEELIHVLGDPATTATSSLSPEVREVLQDLTKIAAQPQLVQAAENLMTEIDNKFPKEAATIKDYVKRMIAPPCDLAIKVDTWFDTVMDRTSDQFQHRARWITVIFAVLLAFVFHIDSLRILDQLASDAQVRAELVQMAGAAQRKAEALIPMSTNPALTAIQRACNDCAAKPAIRAISSSIPDELAAHDKVITWINATIEKPEDRKELTAAFTKRYKETVGPGVGELIESTSQIKTTLEGSKLTVFATPLPGWQEGLRQYRDPKDHYTHFWGTLMTAFFLSLGAPFWYNSLKQLSNLRPAIAQKADLASQPKE